MKKVIIAALAVSGALALSACTPEQKATDLPPGTYKHTTKSTDANGTDVTNKRTTDVTVDRYGNKTAVVKNKTTKDPKGLFNKTTTENSTVVEEK